MTLTLVYGIVAFIISGGLLYIAGELLVAGLLKLSRYFKVTKFAVAFFVMAFAASLPNLFVGVTAALQGVPELSFGDIMGNNIIALTLAVAAGIFFSKKKELPLDGGTMQDTTFLTAVAAILPLILVADGLISRSGGLILVLFFVSYIYWLFSKKDRFSTVFEEEQEHLSRKEVLAQIIKVVVGIVLLALAAQGIVYGATVVATAIGLPMLLVGVLIIGFGGALPEVYFTIVSARRGETSLIVGNLMGAVIIPATLVLGTVALIHPIHNDNLELSFISRLFLVAIALFFLFVSQTKHAITRREGAILLAAYVLFVLSVLLAW